jgi:hypothetical protein
MANKKRVVKKVLPKLLRMPTGFGLPVEWKWFLESNPRRIRALQLLLKTCAKVFIRTGMTDKPAERMGFYLGRMCVEEFNEILLLAGNGYGVGAQKILRGMYERAVTAGYLLSNLDKGELFLDFHHVHKYKAANHQAKIPHLVPPLAADIVAQVKADFEAVKQHYMEETCKRCKRTRIQPSWTKLDTASMAVALGKGYADLYYDAFYRPTLQTHTTVASVLGRLLEHPNGTIGFNEGSQRAQATEAVFFAHTLMLRILITQNDHFQLGLEADLKARCKEFAQTYNR